jgi:two-component system response regulator AtoC
METPVINLTAQSIRRLITGNNGQEQRYIAQPYSLHDGMIMNRGNILIADDDDITRDNLAELLSAYDVRTVSDGVQALTACQEQKFDLIITDLRMPNMDGLQLLKKIKTDDSRAIIIMITGYGTVDSAVESMKLGAFDYITKPLKDDLVHLTVERALSYAKLR